MFKRTSFILLSLLIIAGCSTIQKLTGQGIDSAKKAATKYVDDKAGSGTFDDMTKMKGDQDKIKLLLPYYVKANKMFDEKKISEVQRDKIKKQFDQNYADYNIGKIDLAVYDKQCTALLDIKK